MKHLKFIFLSYTFLNICSVFASEDPINHDDLSPKSAELVSEVNTQEASNNASDVISNNKNKKTIKGNADSDKFVLKNVSPIAFFEDVFFSKKVVMNRDIARVAYNFYKFCQNKRCSYSATRELDQLISERTIPFIIARMKCIEFNYHLEEISNLALNIDSDSLTYTEEKILDHLEQDGKFSRRYKNLLRVIERTKKLLKKYPESGLKGIPLSDILNFMYNK